MTMVRGFLFHVEQPFTQYPQTIFTARRRLTQSHPPKAPLSQRSVSLQDLFIVIPSRHMDLFLL